MSDVITSTRDDRPADVAKIADAAAREVPGVAELFYAAPLPTRLWRATIAPDGAYSVVSRHDDIVDISVSIGVAGGRVDEVARAVANRVRAAVGDPAVRVTVRVSRIATPATPSTPSP
ncbi:hypothetical protein ITJ43_05550 [Microbacterium sp. VKM Ac-2870]|uniref:hypothetical protein n=1 Tax=Microbacterium sp. VKM Ac-2870 TaxID=2783825 RepID=UPI00188B0D16|nr:hypothetical protein [Microbacterium sp. VKM Ac-2870]MBF4561597.1 hypothetical protein [Microbacterium sp. VKM Ac-2870]